MSATAGRRLGDPAQEAARIVAAGAVDATLDRLPVMITLSSRPAVHLVPGVMQPADSLGAQTFPAAVQARRAGLLHQLERRLRDEIVLLPSCR